MHLDGPADRSGKIQEGDVLVAVEGESVAGKGLSFLSSRIPGPLNSIVKLTFNHGQSKYGC
jgi:C-terminal processing protease CtpA/Prc